MSEQTLRRIIIALAAIALLWVGATLLRRGRAPGQAADGPLAQALQRLRDDSAAAAFTITSPAGDRVALERTGSAWTVNGLPADSAAVERLLQTLRDARAGDLVATGAQNHDRLGVHADSAWTLDAGRGDDVIRLLVGRSGRAGTGYLRLADRDETWEVSTDLRSAISRSAGEWRDRTLIRLDTARVARVALTRQRESFALARDSAGWSLEGDTSTRADTLAIRNILAELARFEATAFAADTATFAGDDQRRIVVTSETGDTLADLEVAGREYIWRGRLTGQPTLYEIASYRIDRLIPLRADALRRPDG